MTKPVEREVEEGELDRSFEFSVKASRGQPGERLAVAHGTHAKHGGDAGQRQHKDDQKRGNG